MEKNHAPKSSFVKEYKWYFLFILVLGISLILYGHESPEGMTAEKFLKLIAKDAGLALTIATILVFTVENITRERHEKAAELTVSLINENLFKAIYQRYIPATVFSEVEKCLLTSDVLRTKYEIDYSLEYINDEKARELAITQQDQDSHMLCDVFTTFTLKNITDKPIKQPITVQLELPIDDNLKPLVGIDTVSIGDKPLNESIIKGNTETTDTHSVFSDEVSIPPDGAVKVTMNCHSVKRKTDMEVWASRLPSEGLTLRVSAPKDVQVHATANHSQKLTEDSSNQGRSIWTIDHGIFPYQSIIFWWKAN